MTVARPQAATQWAWVAVVTLALNLRTTVASTSPLVADIRADLHPSGAVLGLLTALPVLCMAWLAAPSQLLVRRAGAEATVVAAAAAVALGNGLRLFGDRLELLLAATFVAGAGVAAAGVALPELVRRAFPARPGAATGAYTVAMMLGAATAAALSVPLRDLLGSWEASMAAWAVPAAAAAALWAARSRGDGERWDHGSGVAAPERSGGRAPGRAGGPAPGLPWRSAAVWTVAAYLGLQSMLAYAYLGWLPPLLQSHGVADQDAGTLLGVHNLAQLVSAVALPAVADRVHDLRRLVVAAVSLTVAGAVWLLLAPGALPWVSVSVLGLGLGGGFALGLVTATAYAASPAAASRVVAMTFTVCYTAAASAPVLVGALHDWSGGYTVPLGLLVLLAVAQWSVALALKPGWRHTVH